MPTVAAAKPKYREAEAAWPGQKRNPEDYQPEDLMGASQPSSVLLGRP